MASRPFHLLPRLLRDRRGAGAVEFALIVPVLLLLCIGGPELTIALMLSKKINHAATVVGDLVTREAQIAVADVDAILDASRGFVRPYDPVAYRIRVSGVRVDTGGRASVRWSRARGLDPLPNGEQVRMAAGSGGASDFVMVETQYAFDPLSGLVSHQPYELSRTAFSAARAGTQVNCKGC